MVTARKKIPTILRSNELLDKAFKKASKIRKEGSDKVDKARKSAISKISVAGDIISSNLAKYVKAFPSLSKTSQFEMELIDVIIGIDKLKKSLGALNWCSAKALELERKYLDKVKRARDSEEISLLRKEFYGRLSSLVNQIDQDLKFVAIARDKLKELPEIDPTIPTVVIAGFPNVGKSQLVERISTARPKIAPYPFTTQGIGIGHIDVGRKRYQIVDTPGLLDRKLEERNKIELQAILALKYLADVIIFLIDPSETSGYSMRDQLALLDSIKANFADIPIIEIENKSDLMRIESPRVKISALTGDGVEELLATIIETLDRTRKPNDGEPIPI